MKKENKTYNYQITYNSKKDGRRIQETDNPEIAANWFFELSKNKNITNLKLERVVIKEVIKITL